jgi:hypothetical protein
MTSEPEILASSSGMKAHTLNSTHLGCREEVADKLARALAEQADGLVYEDENVTVGEYLDSWLKGSVRGSVRQSTFDRYEIAVRVHIKPALGRLKLKNSPPHTSPVSTRTVSPTGSRRPA